MAEDDEVYKYYLATGDTSSSPVLCAKPFGPWTIDNLERIRQIIK